MSFMPILAAYFIKSQQTIFKRFLRVHAIQTDNGHEFQSLFHACDLLEERMGRNSFSHEMFFNFFVADGLNRFSNGIDELIYNINAPKNYDKRLLILCGIDQLIDLDKALQSITDADLLYALYTKEGGAYCRHWVVEQLNYLLEKITLEVNDLEYEFDKENNSLQFVAASLLKWTASEQALIRYLD